MYTIEQNLVNHQEICSILLDILSPFFYSSNQYTFKDLTASLGCSMYKGEIPSYSPLNLLSVQDLDCYLVFG